MKSVTLTDEQAVFLRDLLKGDNLQQLAELVSYGDTDAGDVWEDGWFAELVATTRFAAHPACPECDRPLEALTSDVDGSVEYVCEEHGAVMFLSDRPWICNLVLPTGTVWAGLQTGDMPNGVSVLDTVPNCGVTLRVMARNVDKAADIALAAMASAYGEFGWVLDDIDQEAA